MMQYQMTVIKNGKQVEDREVEDHEVARHLTQIAEGVAYTPLGQSVTITRGTRGAITVRSIDTPKGTIESTAYFPLTEKTD